MLISEWMFLRWSILNFSASKFCWEILGTYLYNWMTRYCINYKRMHVKASVWSPHYLVIVGNLSLISSINLMTVVDAINRGLSTMYLAWSVVCPPNVIKSTACFRTLYIISPELRRLSVIGCPCSSKCT